jgi:predicted NBD/HSP70 family sugar kinase
VLQLIWQEERISRAEISRRADLSRSTVSEIIGTLLPTGIVAETGIGPSSGGRRPILLEFQDDSCFILGAELGASHVAVALTDLRGRVRAWAHRSHPVREDPQGSRELLESLCRSCLDEVPREGRPLLGIGVAVPSPVDPERPDWLPELVLPRWNGRLGLLEMARRFEVPLLVDNDANLGALAEHWWGAACGVDDFAYIKVATGVGSGHVIGGEIYRGATGVAGEIGHLAMDPKGKPCVCGLRGCLATLVGAAALEERTRELAGEHPGSALAAGDISITAIEDAALSGDPLALQVVQEAAEHLGIAVAGMLNLMNPSLVVVGGGLARLGELLLEPLRETVRRRTLVSSVAASEMRTSELGPRATAIGAATLVLKTTFAEERLFPAVAAALEVS